jgi:hypothetical protein
MTPPSPRHVSGERESSLADPHGGLAATGNYIYMFFTTRCFLLLRVFQGTAIRDFHMGSIHEKKSEAKNLVLPSL